MANVNLDGLKTLFDGLVVAADGDQAVVFSNQKRYTGLVVRFDVTAVAAGNVTPKIEYKDPTTDTWVEVLAGSAVSTVTSTTLTVDPRLTGGAGVAKHGVPLILRLVATGAAGADMTYSATAIFYD